jgi:predicted Rossmann fold flavoprotein
LAGIAVDPVRVRLQIPDGKPLEQTGALLITHWGVSGPAILKLSAWGARYLHDCAYQAALEINWLPLTTADALRQMILTAKADTAKRTIAAYSPLPLPHRLWEQLVAITGISPQQRWADLSNKQLLQLLHELTQGRYPIQGKGVFKEEFVTCGGVSLKQVDFKTMESRCCRGLYFAGEVLDIDGVTGGFNFQSAWTTAWIAGQAIGSP